MGVVWRAVHCEQKVPVAIKFLTQEGSTDPLYQACLRNEVRGVAALDHPAIVRVYDYGVVPESLGVESLAVGSPYLVMEFAEGGTLARRSAGLEWSQICRVLMRLLDALAHAHARGVIHRDIKPDNVLLRSSSGGVILTDFGLARAGDTGAGVVLNAGTPSYMAPEQIRQDSQDIGAWTDMYALGCLAWNLVCGRTPFQADTVVDLLDAHLAAPLPDLEPIMEVPSGLEGWIGRLLKKSPHHRFVRAADAAYALTRLQPDHESSEISLEPVFTVDSVQEVCSTSPSGRTIGSVSTDDTQVMTITDRQLDGVHDRPAPMPVIDQPLLLFDRPDIPPMPEHWREEYTPLPSVHLLGTGTGLFGLRNLPVIGREAEQDRLWSMLKKTRVNNETNTMVIRGADGAGKTHLATWLARRAHEVGAGIILRAQFQFAETGDPLVDLIHNLLGTKGMERQEAQERIAGTLDSLGRHDAEEVEALLTVLGPFRGEVYSDELMAERTNVRFTVIRRLLHRFSVLRPVVLLIDDAHRSVDAIDFVRTLAAQQTIERPVMVVVTANTILPADSARKPLLSLLGMKRVELMELGPLAVEHRPVLVRSMLPLEPTLASLVERRSGGNPQFAVQLMGDWILKDAFAQGDGGFRLKPGVKADFPADLQAVWERRLTAALPFDRSTR
ncbi:MAG: protein kinase domain-containing protein, partial [Myxococcota bacterium]